ncbi:glycosyltransferase family 4 protein [Dehalococcoidia bacterium]|nr:glycosyltransferase family 4 protein [Dehalococcoidia bacterium]
MSRDLKIAFISPYDHAIHGGVASHITMLSSQFKAWGHSVKVMAPCSSPQRMNDEDFVPMGRPVPVPSGGSIARVSLSIWLRPRIKQFLQEHSFDVIHVHEPFAGAVPLNVLSLTNAVDSVNVGTFHTYRGTKLYGIGGKRLAMPLFRRLNGRIAVSEAAHDFISRHFPGDYQIIPNGINVDEFANALPIPNLMDDKINLLFLGRLEKRKGLKHLLTAYSKLKWDWPNLRLIVVGSGKPDDESYRIMSERNLQDVMFVGNVSDGERARYFQSAHIYCSPATGSESFGIVLLEAMASGTPVVASDISGYSGLITHGENGLLVPPKNGNELADAIATLIRDPDLRARLAVRGKERAGEFCWERVAAKVIDYYRICLNNKRDVSSK